MLKTQKLLSLALAVNLLFLGNNVFSAEKKAIKPTEKPKTTAVSVKKKEERPDLSKIKYMSPPKEIVKIVDAPKTPSINIAPDKEHLLLLDLPKNPSLEEMSKKELKLAGLRINPDNGGESKIQSYTGIRIKNITKGGDWRVSGLPEKAKINYISWSPDSKHVAFTNTTDSGVTLWIIDINTKTAKELAKFRLNSILGKPYNWISDSKKIICKVIPGDIGEVSKDSPIPDGPIVQESYGEKTPQRTYQNLLQNKHDEALFEHYFTSQIIKLDLEGKMEKIGKKDIYYDIDPSPDGKYLLTEKIHPPYSYLVPINRFPRKVEIWDINGKLVKNLIDLPLYENIPPKADAVPPEQREHAWRNDAPATLYWIEAQDGGDPTKNVPIRDIAYTLSAPFKANKTQLISFQDRFRSFVWGDNKVALAYEGAYKNKSEKIYMFPPDFPDFKPKLLIERSTEDSYKNPGNAVTQVSKYGTNVLLKDENTFSIFFSGEGASPQGNKPFIDKFDLKNKKADRVWESKEPYYEQPIKILDHNDLKILTKIESPTKQPDYYLRTVKKNKLKQLTEFTHPYPELKNVKAEIIKYKRADGVELNATLYLPPNYSKEKNGKLPVLVWAYPREFKDASLAGQITNSPYEFPRISATSPIIFVTQGFAVLDGPSMPIIGEGKTEPNDTYIKQLSDDAKAAVDKIVSMGVADPKKIAIGGHSYGAFMTANLLAHTDLFCAGIARSGAYNRTLTPFGFQSEERYLWQAPKIYSEMSPFNYADKIKEPILLIHGKDDDNPGTFTLQSERMFGAIKGLGGKARLVVLPYESHHYQARESILHMLWEMNEWLNKNVKNKE
ncbi:MAG: prolyl oligopeptidase family serine peptidase [Candidatus Sericytochromatia bacterium]